MTAAIWIGALIILVTAWAVMWNGIGTIETDEDVKKQWKDGPETDKKDNYRPRHRRTRKYRFRIPHPPYLRNFGQHSFS